MSSELAIQPDSSPPANRPTYRRLKDADKAQILRYVREGLSQRDIARRLAITQGAVSQWVSQCQDTKLEATQYLDGQALTMAIKAATKGTPTDLIKLLTGRGVVGEAQNGPNIVINIGGNDADVCLITAQVSTSCSKEHGSK